ncbi:antibiotic biosynthesis monooxygenase [Curtobacterium sp. MCJR17_043]|uniref:antibiotic biosynthesis monooxygenase n=1 Tax=Curtobacterium sp. MCJR17_043 TaxID=2175660 RepID=UPI0032E90C3E
MSITRLVEPDRIPEVTRWVQSGVNLANRYPGFLGSGWVRSTAQSREWHMLYRFADHDSLTTWENSDDRLRWLDLGRDLVVESRVEKRTGIEGWFDVPQDAPASTAPPALEAGGEHLARVLPGEPGLHGPGRVAAAVLRGPVGAAPRAHHDARAHADHDVLGAAVRDEAHPPLAAGSAPQVTLPQLVGRG